jgi:hypothetical protein
MIELPGAKINASRVNPKTMILFGQPKTGKTTALADLDSCLTIDLEEGSDFVSSLKIDVQKEARKANKPPIAVLNDIINSLREANTKKGGYVYKYIAVDTVTALEDLVLPLAKNMYQQTPMGRNWVGEDVTTLPNGAGYRYTRMALQTVIDKLTEVTDTLIIVGHVKDKMVLVEGEEMSERGLDLTGKMSSILCVKADAVGYIYRKENETRINFQSSESLLVGARSEHLKGQDICIAVSDDDGNITIDWSNVFKAE